MSRPEPLTAGECAELMLLLERLKVNTYWLDSVAWDNGVETIDRAKQIARDALDVQESINV